MADHHHHSNERNVLCRLEALLDQLDNDRSLSPFQRERVDNLRELLVRPRLESMQNFIERTLDAPPDADGKAAAFLASVAALQARVDTLAKIVEDERGQQPPAHDST